MHKALKLAQEFNKYFISSNGIDVSSRITVSRDEWRELFKEIVYLNNLSEAQNTAIEDMTRELDGCEDYILELQQSLRYYTES